jgi:hypothetical protein
MYTFGMSASTKKITPSTEAGLARLMDRHRDLIAELAGLGLVLRGSIALRMNRCGNPDCRCKADPPVLHGPYNVWTRKVAGKTVTVTLDPAEAALCREWNRNIRKLDRIVREIQKIGLRAASLVRRPR